MNHFKILFSSMCFLIFLNFTTFALPMSFYPALADSLGLSTFLISLSFTISSFGAFLCSFMAGIFMRFMGKGYLVLFLQIIASISTFLFGLLPFFMDSPFFFYIFSVVLRFINGFSLGGFYTVVYSFVPEYWHDEVSKRIALLELSASFGTGMGPIINSAIFHYFGFSQVFFFSGTYTCLFGIVTIIKFIKINEKKSEKTVEKTLCLKKIISDPGLIVCFLFLTLNYDGFAITFPIFETHLIKLGFKPSLGSLIWTINQIGYIMGIFICIYIKKHFQAKKMLITGSICCSFSLFFLGPDPILNVQSNNMKILLIIISMWSIGLFLALILIFMIPEFILLLGKVFPGQRELNGDMGTGLYGASLAASQIIGPLIGGLLNDFFGFERGCSLFGLTLTLFLCIYLRTFSGELSNRKDGKEEVKEIEINLI